MPEKQSTYAFVQELVEDVENQSIIYYQDSKEDTINKKADNFTQAQR